MKKWIAIGIFFIGIVITSLLIWLYQSAYAEHSDVEERLGGQILREEGVTSVGNWYHYRGDDVITVATVMVDGQEEYWFFNDELARFDVIATDSVITEEEAINSAMAGTDDASSLRRVALGLEAETPIFEVIYEDETGAHVYHVVDAYSGETSYVYRLP